MSELVAASLTAFWLGILAAISPCPLATNVAAISYMGKDLNSGGRIVTSGALYALGRVAAYVLVAVLVVSSVLSIPAVASFLQGGKNRILGPLLIVIGSYLRDSCDGPLLRAGQRRGAAGGPCRARTLVRNKEITQDIYRRFAGKLALNCFVIDGGEISVGDEVELVRGRACAESAAAAVFAE